MRDSKHLLVLLLALAPALGLAASAARAHEDGVLRLASGVVTAGGSVAVSGENFARNTTFRLVLKGALRDYELGSVDADAGGAFSRDLTIAADVARGTYRLVAMAPDGDEAAAVDLEIAAALTPPQEAADAGAHPAVTSPMPSADDLVIERRYSGIEWLVIGLLFGAALAGGILGIRGLGDSGRSGS